MSTLKTKFTVLTFALEAWHRITYAFVVLPTGRRPWQKVSAQPNIPPPAVQSNAGRGMYFCVFILYQFYVCLSCHRESGESPCGLKRRRNTTHSSPAGKEQFLIVCLIIIGLRMKLPLTSFRAKPHRKWVVRKRAKYGKITVWINR